MIYVTTDARGKVLRRGDRVHLVSAARTVNKHEPNGRCLEPQRAYKVKAIDGEDARLRTKLTMPGRALVKE